MPLDCATCLPKKTVWVYSDDIVTTDRVFFPESHQNTEYRIGHLNQSTTTINDLDLGLDQLYRKDDPLEAYEKMSRLNTQVYGTDDTESRSDHEFTNEDYGTKFGIIDSEWCKVV